MGETRPGTKRLEQLAQSHRPASGMTLNANMVLPDTKPGVTWTWNLSLHKCPSHLYFVNLGIHDCPRTSCEVYLAVLPFPALPACIHPPASSWGEGVLLFQSLCAESALHPCHHYARGWETLTFLQQNQGWSFW